ncbi:4'-phosphopantetheinyl transferase [candidate division TM7 genomosp. GTL1]|nr:4'-phosphopantetheinyl transferase [candidate division TM7 genomosp. GTL1]
MPIFFQQQINESTRLGIWKIEETEEFFKGNVPQHRDVTHPHKRLQHLAGRFLLQFLFPAFPYDLVEIADTRKPFLPGEQYHFSISHCGDFAAAIVSKQSRVGVDIEIPSEKIERVKDKFLSGEERNDLISASRFNDRSQLTMLWSCKEAVFKWHGDGGVDFSEDILLQLSRAGSDSMPCFFKKSNTNLTICYHVFDQLVLAWTTS